MLQGEQGLVVAWDAAHAERQVVEAGGDLEHCAFVPEPLICEPLDEGVRLLTTAEGCEAQAWQGSQLHASQWWPERPAAQDWANFLRASGHPQPPVAEVPEPVERAPYRSRPWGAVFGMQGDEAARTSEQRLVRLVGLTLILCLGLVGRQWWDLTTRLNEREAELLALRGDATQRNQARERALNAAAEARKWSHWLTAPLPIDVIDHLNTTLPAAGGVVIKQLELNGNKLRLGLQPASGVQRASLVRSLQAGGWFRDVAEVRGDDGQGLVQLEMRIDGLRPAPRATIAEAPAPVAPGPAAPTAAAQAPRPMPPAAQAPAEPIPDFPPQSVFDAIGKKK